MEGSGGGFQNPFSRELPPPPSICSIRRGNTTLADSDQRLAEAIADAQHHRPRWHQHAACRGGDTATFFPVHSETAGTARAICSTCPVIDECLTWALGFEAHGVAGGLSARQRRQLRAERKRA
ncbi:MAG: WhiB family transcriptional regulator [Actinomycetota bacterium]|nr:WhiB family transcriptional regulator [Actinomycetota bacterium]